MAGATRRRRTTRNSTASTQAEGTTKIKFSSPSSSISDSSHSTLLHQTSMNEDVTRPPTTRSTRNAKRQDLRQPEGDVPDIVSTSAPSMSSSTVTSSNNDHTQKQISSVDQVTSERVVLWVRENYEIKPNSNVPRSGIFEHYKHYCTTRHVKPVNAATFGKLIRAAFPNIATRRLGNRGQSKYQYCNIQRRETAEDIPPPPPPPPPTTTAAAAAAITTMTGTNDDHQQSTILSPSLPSPSDPTQLYQQHPQYYPLQCLPYRQQQQQQRDGNDTNTTSYFMMGNSDDLMTNTSTNPPHTTIPSLTVRLPTNGPGDNNISNTLTGSRDLPIFRLPPPFGYSPSISSKHTRSYNNGLVSDFPDSPATYHHDQGPSSPTRSSSSSMSTMTASTSAGGGGHSGSVLALPTIDVPGSSSSSYRQLDSWNTTQLSTQFADLYNRHCRNIYNNICTGQFEMLQGIYENFYHQMHPHFRTLLNEMPDIYDSIWRWDCVLYDSLIVDLLPEVDTPTSNHMMSGLRQYTRSLPQFLQQLLKDYPQALRQKKCDVANIFVAKIRRQLTLNQFAIATGKILGRPDLLGAMKTDWEQLDVGIVLDHVLWVCDCRNNDMRQILEKDLVRLLTVGTTLDQWMKWEEQLLDKFVPATPKIRDIQDIEKYLAMAKQFVLKWKTYTGLIMQHFYMKNIGSIDSFNTLQFFFDELILYHVEERIARMNADVNQRLSPERSAKINSNFSATNIMPTTTTSQL